MKKSIRRGAFVALTVLVLIAGWAGTGRAGPVSLTITEPGIALFEGRHINLAEGWGEARACMVWTSIGVVECFRTEQQMVARETQLLNLQGLSGGAPALTQQQDQQKGLRPASTATASASGGYGCSSPLRLYEHSDFYGRQLAFWDAGYWQNLTDWGFNDVLSSFKTGGCGSYMAEHIWGGGEWYYGAAGAYRASSYVGWYWNDRISSIYSY
ncbi:MAG: hypothetical protein ACRD12_21715 [Acidimicrobiales bacterium]